MPRIVIRSFDPDDLDAAGHLLAARHAAHRRHRPGLDPRWADPTACRTAVQEALAGRAASGVVAVDDGVLAGYLIGTPLDDAVWGPNIWVEAAGQAVARPSIIRDLYAVAAGRWVDEGRTEHYVMTPATDPELIHAWFSLDFGRQHITAIRPAPEAGWQPGPPPDVTVRVAERRDIPIIAELDLVLPRHLAAAPVFSRLPVRSLDETLAEVEREFGDERFPTFVVDHDGRVIGFAVGCAIELSSMHAGLARPVDAAFLGYAAVLPEARGMGAGRALGEAVLAWARDTGYAWVVTDWRSANLEADRAWPSLGFEPVFSRLHRSIS